MSKRTYYAVEMGAASYPVHELHVQAKPFLDPTTNAHAYRVRAESIAEATQIFQERLNEERYAACQEQNA